MVIRLKKRVTISITCGYKGNNMLEEPKIRLLRVAYQAALNSPDPSSQNGAVLLGYDIWGCGHEILTTGYNHFYDGIPEEVEDREKKLQRIEHAERDVIFKAARSGVITQGMVMVCPWAACYDCARAMIGAGISTLVTHLPRYRLTHDPWKTQVDEALDWLICSGMEVDMVNEPIPDTKPIRIGGRLWSPETLEFVENK